MVDLFPKNITIPARLSNRPSLCTAKVTTIQTALETIIHKITETKWGEYLVVSDTVSNGLWAQVLILDSWVDSWVSNLHTFGFACIYSLKNVDDQESNRIQHEMTDLHMETWILKPGFFFSWHACWTWEQRKAVERETPTTAATHHGTTTLWSPLPHGSYPLLHHHRAKSLVSESISFSFISNNSSNNKSREVSVSWRQW